MCDTGVPVGAFAAMVWWLVGLGRARGVGLGRLTRRCGPMNRLLFLWWMRLVRRCSLLVRVGIKSDWSVVRVVVVVRRLVTGPLAV